MQEPIMGMKNDKTVEMKPGQEAKLEVPAKPGDLGTLKITLASEGQKEKKEPKSPRGLQAFRNA
jgi:hypothetical protein